MIELEEICAHIDGHLKPLVESRMILKARYLQKIGEVPDLSNASVIHVRGLSLRVSSSQGEPVQIDVKITKPFPGVVAFATCECDGGRSGKCKHTVALLRVLMSSTTVESWTCTEGPCAWKASLKAVQEEIANPVPLREFCHHVKEEETLPVIPNFFNSEIFLAMLEKIPDNSAFKKDFLGRGTSAAVQHIKRMNDIYYEFPLVLTLYKRRYEEFSLNDLIHEGDMMNFHLSMEQINDIEKNTRGQSSNPLWFRFKKGRITASNIGSVSKVRSFDSNKSLLRRICYPGSNKFSTEATRYGYQHERDAVRLYIQRSRHFHTNLKVRQVGLFISFEYPFVGASPDAIVTCDCCDDKVLEVKCPYCLKQKSITELKYLKTKAGTMELNRKHVYYYQVEAEMFCLGVQQADFMVWSANEECYLETIPRNDKFIQVMLEKAKAFFRNAVLPELLGKYYTRRNSTDN